MLEFAPFAIVLKNRSTYPEVVMSSPVLLADSIAHLDTTVDSRCPKLRGNAFFRVGILTVILSFSAAIKAQSPADGFDPNANNSVLATAVQSDGKILLGGFFTTVSPNGGPAVTRNRIARLNPDGTLDVAFNPNANNGVRAIVLQNDGKILI